MSGSIRIGTRDSKLALWQALTVEKTLNNLGSQTLLKPVKSEGDLNLTQPIYSMGISGVFTRGLDAALLDGEIDIAVHSMKDVPTALAKGLKVVAVLERGSTADVLVKSTGVTDSEATVIATGSLRRKAQWLRKHPNHNAVGLRGNVQTRLEKVASNDWIGGIFAKAGLERLALHHLHIETLDWMLPAPAQGAVVVVAREDRSDLITLLDKINHTPTTLAVTVEREFLRLLEGGCSSPIGALAEIHNNTLYFKGGLFSLDGAKAVCIEKEVATNDATVSVASWVKEVLDLGGKQIIDSLRNG
jgi:hydroxymethylbilane synthase